MNEKSISWTVSPAADLSTYAQEWDALNGRVVGLPIMDADFFIELLRYFGTGREKLVLGRTGDTLIVAGLMSKRKSGVWATFQPSQAPLGAWLAEPGVDQRALWSSLLRVLPQPGLLLGLSQQDPRLSVRPVDGGSVQTLDYIQTASITVSGSFADYWAARGRNLRQNLKRQRNRLDRENQETRLEVLRDPDQIGEAVDDFGRLESKGWKGEKGTALHPDNAQGRFYKAIFVKLARRSEATIYRYWYNDSLAATDLCVQRDHVLIILKTTHEEGIAKTSPTHLMRQEVFKQLFENGEIHRIEFYGKLMDWHTRWSDEIRRMYHVNYFRWPLFALVKTMLGQKLQFL